jgi:hypothetical protein
MDCKKIILDLCGGTGSWSQPYADAGYDVRVVTLPKNDVRLYVPPRGVHGILAAPPCTEFSFAKHYHGKDNYTHDFLGGLEIVSACMRIILTANPVWWCLENPRGYLARWLGEPDMVFNPWQFGDDYQKTTCLWGKFNQPNVLETAPPKGIKKFSELLNHEIYPEYIETYSRKERRAITPPGFARAFFEVNN